MLRTAILSLLVVILHAGHAQWYRYAELPLNAVPKDVASNTLGTLVMLTTDRQLLRRPAGGSWNDISHWGMIDPQGVSMDPQSGHIYVGTRFQGLFRSADNGATWQMTWMVTSPVSGHHEGYQHIAQTTTPGVFFASQMGRTRITRFSNYGAVGVERELGQTFDDLAGALIHTSDQELLVHTPTGIRRSTDQGVSFTLVAPTNGHVVAFAEDADARVYALVLNEQTLQSGLMYSDDRINWHPDAVPPGVVATSLWYDGDTDALWLGTRTGIHRRAVGDTPWTDMGLNDPPHVVVEVIGDQLGGVYDFSEQFIAQKLEGAVWSPIVQGLTGKLDRVLFTPSNTLLGHTEFTSNSVAVRAVGATAWSQEHLNESVSGVRQLEVAPDGRVFASTTRTLFRSEDDGSSFAPIELPSDFVAQQSGYVGLVRTGEQNGLFAVHSWIPSKLFGSFDQGASWSLVSDIASTGIGASFSDLAQDAQGRFYSLQIGQHTGSTIRVFRSADQGGSWTQIPFDNGSLFPFDNHELRSFGDRTYVIGARSLYEVHATPEPAITPIPVPFISGTNQLMSFKRTDGGKLIIGSHAQGVYVSEDDGTTWEQLGWPATTVDATAPLADVANYDELPFIIVAEDNAQGLAGGVYYHVPLTTAVVDAPAPHRSVVFPNPASDQVTVTTADPIRSIEVLDPTGRVLRVLRPTSATRLQVDLQDLPAGCALLRVITATGTEVHRFMRL